MNCEALFSPAEFNALAHRDLSAATCVVFDVLRATTSMVTALSNGATGILPVRTIEEALSLRRQRPEVLLAGERQGLRIRADQTGSIDFDLGNSPREFTAETVAGRSIVMTTTNGTRALQACIGAKTILAGAFLNLRTIAGWLRHNSPEELIVVCAGTFEEAAYEDALAAGALCGMICEKEGCELADSAQIARQIHDAAGGDLAAAMRFSKNARRLLANPDLREDVPVALQCGTVELLAELRDGIVKKITV